MDTTTTTPELPRQLGRYEILGLIGEGGMGAVYRGYDPPLKRDVAVKVPHFTGPPARQAEQARRFEREALAAAQIRHPNVCPVFDVGTHEGQPFLVMALVAGESLAGYLAREGRVADVGRVVDWAGQLLDALAAVHARGLVHRDLKPGNILLDAGRPVVTDFGLSRSFLGPDSVTADGVILGTVAYMAPEQAAGEADRIGPRTDLYSLGVVLYQLLTGRLPFEGPSLVVLNRILHDPPPAPRSHRPDLPAELDGVLLKALAKAPEDRYPDAGAFAAALVAPAGPGETTAFDPPPPVSVPPAPVAGRGGRITGWLVGGVFFALAAMMVSWWPLSKVLSGQVFLDAKDLPLGRDHLFSSTVMIAFALVVSFLGAAVWALTESFYSAAGLHRWVRAGSVWAVGRTAAAGVPLDDPDPLGATPLMVATAKGHVEVVSLLLLVGADPRPRNLFGQTARDIALANGRGEIVALLDRPLPDRRPAAARVRRPRPVLAVLVFAGLGGVVFGLGWRQGAAHPVSPEHLVELAGRGELKEVEFANNYVRARVTGAGRAALPGDRVLTGPIPDPVEFRARLHRAAPTPAGNNLGIVLGWSPRSDLWPGDWVLPVLAAACMAYFGLVFGLLFRIRRLFPSFNPAPPGQNTLDLATASGRKL